MISSVELGGDCGRDGRDGRDGGGCRGSDSAQLISDTRAPVVGVYSRFS